MEKTVKIALLLTAVDKMNSIVSNAMSKSKKAVKALDGIGSAAAIVGGVVTGLFTKTVADARESEKANKRLEQVFRSMGDTTGKAAKQAEDYASKLEFQIGVEDESIQLTQAKLATFKAVSSETARMAGVFDQATQYAYDLAATGFGTAEDNAVQLGKALQDPVKGIGALKRAGVTFTDQEKNKIKALVKSNKTLEAQKIILNALKTQVGGVAASTADPLDKMHVAFTEISEQVGKFLLPYLQKFATWVSGFVPKMQTWLDKNQRLVKAIAAVGVALLFIGAVSKVVAAILETNPIVLAIMAIAAIAILIITYWKPIKEFFAKLWNGVKSIFSAVWNWIKNLFLKYTPLGLIVKHWKFITNFFKWIWSKVKQTFSATWAWIKGLLMKYTPIGLIVKYWGPISNFFSNIWQKVKNVFVTFWNWLKGIGKMFWDAGKNIIKNIWEGIKSMINKPIQAVKDMVKKIRDYLPFSPAKIGALKDIHKIKLVETIAATIKPQPALQAMQRTTQSIANFSGGGTQTAQPIAVRNGGHTFNVSVNLSGSATAKDGKILADSFKQNVLKVMRDEDKRKQRVSFS